jgi:hypothetical protein
MTDTDTMLAIGIMEDIWHEMGAEIVQWTINNTDFWENDLIYPYMNEDKDPADINWEEIFYNFLDRFKTDAATDEEYIQIDRVVYGEVGFLLDTEHMGGHKYMSGRVGVSDTAMTSWTYSNNSYLGAVFGYPGSGSEEGVDHDRIIIDGQVSLDDVDWATTIAMNISNYWDEKEIVIPDGTKLWNIDILRNGEHMTTIEEGFAADWGNATVSSGVDEIDRMLGKKIKYNKKMPIGKWAAEDSLDEMIEKVGILNEAWNKDVDPDKVKAAKKGAKSDYVGVWTNTPKLPKFPPAGQSWCALQPFYDTLVKQEKTRKGRFKRLGTALKPSQKLIVTDGAGIGNREFVVGPRGTDVAYKQYQRKCNKCNQAWVASQKDVDKGNKAKERCWKCGEKNNYTEAKKSIAYREIKFPVTTPNCNDTLAYVSLTGDPAKKLESVLRPGSVIEVQGWIKPGKEWKYKNNKKFLVDALLITLGSTQHGGFVKLIKR